MGMASIEWLFWSIRISILPQKALLPINSGDEKVMFIAAPIIHELSDQAGKCTGNQNN